MNKKETLDKKIDILSDLLRSNDFNTFAKNQEQNEEILEERFRKENKYNKYLPIGTIILLKNGKKKVMITGFCASDKNQFIQYDYVGCLYPEGMISSDKILMFNHNQIDKIYHLGYRDNEEIEFKKYLDSYDYNINKKLSG